MNEEQKGVVRQFYCDPEKNTSCSKLHCHVNGGPCRMTTHIEFATNTDKVVLVFPVMEGDKVMFEEREEDNK